MFLAIDTEGERVVASSHFCEENKTVTMVHAHVQYIINLLYSGYWRVSLVSIGIDRGSYYLEVSQYTIDTRPMHAFTIQGIHQFQAGAISV